MPEITLHDWPTVYEAAEILKTSVRTLRRKNDEGKLELRQRTRKGKKPETVVNPLDLESMKPAPYFHLGKPEPIQNTKQSKPSAEDLLQRFIEFLEKRQPAALPPAPDAGKVTIGNQFSVSELSMKLWLSIPEAAAYSGFAESQIRKAIELGNVKAVRGGPHRAWIIKRDSLEAL